MLIFVSPIHYLSAERFIAARISGSGEHKGNISKPIVKIGIIGVAIGTAVMLLTVGIVLGFKGEIIRKITGLTTHIAISSINLNASNEPEPITISEDSLNTLKNLPFVEHLQRSAFKNGLLKTDSENEGVLVKGVGNDYDFGFLSEHLTEGKLPDFKGSEAGKDIFISSSLKTKLGLQLNQRVLVHFISQHTVYDSLAQENIIKSDQRSRKFTICGVFKTDFADFDDKLCFIDLRHLQKINFWDTSQVGNYELRVKDFERLSENLNSVKDITGYNYTVSSVKEIYYNVFVWLDKLDVNGIIILVLMIVVATINMITALLILILERANMVGLVKALGMRNVSVRKIFLFVALKLIGQGLLWGNIAGIGLCLLQYYFKIAKLDSETYYVDYIVVALNWPYFFILNLGTFAVCALMLVLPTLVITKLTPVNTLKLD